VTAQLQERQHGKVVAAIQAEILVDAILYFFQALDIAGCFLDAENIAVPRRLANGCGKHIGAGTARHVVQHHRLADCIRNGLEMSQHSILGRLVVVRHDQQIGIDAGFGNRQRQVDSLGGRIGAGPGHDWQPTGGEFHGTEYQLNVLVSAQRCSFTRRARDDQAIAALRHMKVNQTLERRIIDPIMFVKGCYQGDQGACEHELSSP
jgi:hypothetical protein